MFTVRVRFVLPMVTDVVTPVGALLVVVPAASEYHCTVPADEVAMFAVVTLYGTLSAEPDIG